MAETMHAFLNERLRLALSGKIPGSQLDSLVGNLAHLFKAVRPELTPCKIFVAVSEPSICGHPYCSCSSRDSNLQKYKITIFVDRKEQGRRVTNPWLRVTSEVGLEDAVAELMNESDDLIAETKSKAAEAETRKKLLQNERYEIKPRKSSKCLVETFEAQRGRARGFTLPSMGLHHRGTL